jgi:hypothetical protein
MVVHYRLEGAEAEHTPRSHEFPRGFGLRTGQGHGQLSRLSVRKAPESEFTTTLKAVSALEKSMEEFCWLATAIVAVNTRFC